MTWPLEPVGIRDFARGLEDIIVVEEKRSFIESQMKEYMYNWDHATRPSVVGKYDEAGEWILPSTNELTPATHRPRDRQAPVALLHLRRASTTACAASPPRNASWRCRAPTSRAPRTTARAARTTPRPWCRKARARSAASAATTWSPGWTASTDTFTQMGGEGVDLVRPGAVHRRKARLPEPRRRHLLPFRLAGDPPGDRRQGQHHLQDPLQRRGRDDRRPAGRRHADRARHRPPGAQPKACRPSSCCRDDIEKWSQAGDLPERRRVPRTATSSTRCRSACAKCPAPPC